MAAMRQAVQQRGRHSFALKYLIPFGKPEIAGNQQAGSFIAVCKDLEQKLRATTAEGDIAQLIADQQVSLVQLRQQFLQLILFLGLLQAVDQIGGGEEADTSSLTAGRQSQCYRQVSLPGSRAADQAAVEALIDPITLRKLKHLVLVQGRRQAEIVTVEVLHHREAGTLDPRGHCVGRSVGDLQLSQAKQVLHIPFVAFGSFPGKLAELRRDGRQAQVPQVCLQQ